MVLPLPRVSFRGDVLGKDAPGVATREGVQGCGGEDVDMSAQSI